MPCCCGQGLWRCTWPACILQPSAQLSSMHCVAAAGLWRFLRDGKLTDKTYTMAELRDRIDYGDRDPVWGGLVCRDSDSLWLPLCKVSLSQGDRSAPMAGMQDVVALGFSADKLPGSCCTLPAFLDTEGC